MDTWVRALALQHEDLSSNLQHSYTKQGVAALVYTIVGTVIGRSRAFTGEEQQMKMKTPDVLLCLLHAYT